MFDTPVTIIGNVLTAPEWRRTTTTGTMLVTFKVASTSRRFDKDRGMWVDGDSLRVRVACWRRLGENVSLSVQLGDPVVVCGRLFSRDWTDDAGARRTSYELDAVALGHDLSRGVGKFARRRATVATDMVNDEAAATAIGGDLTEPVADPERPVDLPPDHELFDDFDAAVTEPLDPAREQVGPEAGAGPESDGGAAVETAPEPVGAATAAGGRPRGAGRPRAGRGAGTVS
jgi:single-strand DNA-binding protein